MKYFSQCGEDQIIHNLFFRNYFNGIFLEMGALDGLLYSNTKFFEDNLSWTGVLIEPNPVQFELLENNRPFCKNFNALVSDSTEDLNFKYFHNAYAAVSGVNETLPDLHNEVYFDKFNEFQQSTIKIKPRSLTSIIEESGFKHIDFFSLDLEGHEFNVLNSFDFSIPIKLILLEKLGSEGSLDPAEQLLINRGFVNMGRCAHNVIYCNRNYITCNF